MRFVLVVLALYAGDEGGAYEVHTEAFRTQAACEQAAQELIAIPPSWNSSPKIKAVCIKDGP
jgi:hypothetical protein